MKYKAPNTDQPEESLGEEFDPPSEAAAQFYREPDWTGRDFSLAVTLSLSQRMYDGRIETPEGAGHPIHAIEAIIATYNAGLAPPAWTMAWLGPAFRAYYASAGQDDIRELLGLAARGRGGREPVKQYFTSRRTYYRSVIVHVLVERFDLPVLTAAKMVVAREPGITARRLRESYANEWRETLRNDPTILDDLLPLDDSSMQKFLHSFPPEARALAIK